MIDERQFPFVSRNSISIMPSSSASILSEFLGVFDNHVPVTTLLPTGLSFDVVHIALASTGMTSSPTAVNITVPHDDTIVQHTDLGADINLDRAISPASCYPPSSSSSSFPSSSSPLLPSYSPYEDQS